MTEKRVGFLCNIAFNLPAKNDTYKLLKSYYLLRCNEVTKGYGLPPKYFSSVTRCPHCFSDWNKNSDVKVQPLKLNKKQKKKFRMESKQNSDKSETQGNLYNEMVNVCTLCKKSVKSRLTKPKRQYNTSTTKNNTTSIANNPIVKNQAQQEMKKVINKQSIKQINSSKPDNKVNIVNLYSNAVDVFSLKNSKNTLSSTIKEPAKVIKNNKKRKDKFAGLCQKAVLASAKLKEQKDKEVVKSTQNKLTLFLKPSST